jgi:hypothetical protein
MMGEEQHGSATAAGCGQAVAYGKPGPEAASFQSSHLSKRSFEDVLTRLRNEIGEQAERLFDWVQRYCCRAGDFDLILRDGY